MRNAYKILVGKREGKGELGRQKCRWEDSVKRILEEQVMRAQTELSYLRIISSGDSCEHGNKLWGTS
jgi:hypothetical protein